LVADQAQLEFLRSGPKLLHADVLSHIPRLRGLVCGEGWAGELPIKELDALAWLQMGEPPTGTGRTKLYEGIRPSMRVLHVVSYPFNDLHRAARAFPNLEHLSIGRSPKLVSLEGIQALAPSLRSLELFYDSKLADLKPLATLGGLEALSMESVRGATDLGSLRNVPSLRFLSIEVPQLPSIRPLAGHPGLEVLTTYARIADRDPSPLDTMPRLQAYSGWLWKLAKDLHRFQLTRAAAAEYRG